MPKADLAKRQEWEAYLKDWELSGLSAAHWCRANCQKHYNFKYWKNKLRKGPHTFCELKDQKALNIEMRVGQLVIQFPTNLELSLVKQYLKTLLELAC